MKKRLGKSIAGDGTPWHPLWMRALTVFCMALLGVASTIQVCHSHDDVAPVGLKQVFSNTAQLAAPQAEPAGHPDSPDSNSAVRCPLCVAMHSALPVTHTLVEVATLRLEPAPVITAHLPRSFFWRFELASRPPPASHPIA